MTFENPYQDLIEKRKKTDPEFAKKVENEPDFFSTNARKEGAVSVCGIELKSGEELTTKEAIVEAIQTVEDPEIPVNIYDLGLIYSIKQLNNGDVSITMTLTAPNCPVAGEIPKWVGDAVANISGVGKVNVTLTWSPKWTKDMMSEDAKMALDFF